MTFGHIAGSGSNTFGDSNSNSNTLNGQTQVIYKQFQEMLQVDGPESGGFYMSSQGSSSIKAVETGPDEYFWALIGKRTKYKDRMNKKSWTLVLSGSNATGSAGVSLSLTDDSKYVASTATPGGPRYNIVSGSLGALFHPDSGSSYRTFGHFYPEMGIMMFSGPELSASIPGAPNYGANVHTASAFTASLSASIGTNNFTSSYTGDLTASLSVGQYIQVVSASYSLKTKIIGMRTVGTTGAAIRRHVICGSAAWNPPYGGTNVKVSIHCSASKANNIADVTSSFSVTDGNSISGSLRASSSGFAPNLNAKGNPKNALRFINCMRNVNGTTLRLRSEEDKTEENYFCRIQANQYNFSTNHTFVSGSKNKIRNADMHGNPQTFITGVGLYNSAGQLLAIAKLSKPALKNFASEATIKVKLTY